MNGSKPREQWRAAYRLARMEIRQRPALLDSGDASEAERERLARYAAALPTLVYVALLRLGDRARPLPYVSPATAREVDRMIDRITGTETNYRARLQRLAE